MEKISYKIGLKSKDYDVGDNNCQDFMKYVIYFLRAKRRFEEREIHMIAKLHIPYVLLYQIEENEVNCDEESGSMSYDYKNYKNERAYEYKYKEYKKYKENNKYLHMTQAGQYLLANELL